MKNNFKIERERVALKNTTILRKRIDRERERENYKTRVGVSYQ